MGEITRLSDRILSADFKSLPVEEQRRISKKIRKISDNLRLARTIKSGVMEKLLTLNLISRQDVTKTLGLKRPPKKRFNFQNRSRGPR